MDPIVSTEFGKVRGRAQDDVAVFLGMPYAAPPFGDAHLDTPRPVAAWDGPRDAFVYSATAPQPPGIFPVGIPEPVIEGEDCLTVNVFTPDTSASLPVLVWIHGGGFVAGCSASPWYHGGRFARDGVVLVSIGYRLGAEGFLHLDDAPSNRAVRDWLAALAWVRDNIAAFGGDPSAVTIAGQSAGSAACTTLLAIPAAEGLFRGIIAMSGVGRGMSLRRARSVTEGVAAELGVEPTRAALAACSVEALVEAQQQVIPVGLDTVGTGGGGGGGKRADGWSPVIDGDLLAGKPLDAIRNGTGKDVVVLAGATAEEFTAGVRDGAPALDDDLLQLALVGLGLDKERQASYRAAHARVPAGEVLGQAVTDRLFHVPVQRLAEARMAASGAPTFTYEFRWRSHAPGDPGAMHCLDVPFAFDNLDAVDVDAMAGPEPPQGLADAMHTAWVRFVTDGDPGWAPYDLDRRAAMVFDTPCAVVDDPLAFERELWAPHR